MPIKLSSGDYPIEIVMGYIRGTVSLEEFDDLIRKMVEFRVTYDEKKCREVKEEDEPDDDPPDDGWWEEQDREDAAYEAERIARELEAEGNGIAAYAEDYI